MVEETKNLRKFLESDDPALIRMGLSMAKGSGVPEELLGEILWLYMVHDDKTIRAAAKSIFMRFAPEDAKQVVKENWKPNYRNAYTKTRWGGGGIRNKVGYFNEVSNLGQALCQTSVSLVRPLIKALNDKNDDVFRNAVVALMTIESTRPSVIKAPRKYKAEGGHIKWKDDPRAIAEFLRTFAESNPTIQIDSNLHLIHCEQIVISKHLNSLFSEGHDPAWILSLELKYGSNIVYHETDAMKRVVEALINALEEDRGYGKAYTQTHQTVEDCANWSAAEALGEIGDKRAVEPLIKTLEDNPYESEWGVRNIATEALGNIGDERAIGPLIRRLVGCDGKKEYYEELIGYNFTALALNKLGWVPKTDDEKSTYLIAVKDWKSLVEWGEPAVDPLIKALREFTIMTKAYNPRTRDYDNSVICSSIAETLGNIGDKRAVEELIRTLNHNAWRVKSAASWALGNIGDKRALEPIIKTLKMSKWKSSCEQHDTWVKNSHHSEECSQSLYADCYCGTSVISALTGESETGLFPTATKALKKLGHKAAQKIGDGGEIDWHSL